MQMTRDQASLLDLPHHVLHQLLGHLSGNAALRLAAVHPALDVAVRSLPELQQISVAVSLRPPPALRQQTSSRAGPGA